MLTARNVIAATIVIAVLSILLTCVSLLQPPDSGGLGRDSYGTRAAGHRALFELLQELHVSVERRFVPPPANLEARTTLVFWGPDANLVAVEPGHLQRVAEWVRSGGRVVVAVSPSERDGFDPTRLLSPGGLAETTILKELGLENVRVKLAGDVASGPSSAAAKADEKSASPHPWKSDDLEDFKSVFFDTAAKPEMPTREIAVDASGSLSYLKPAVASLLVPATELQVLDWGHTNAIGRLTTGSDEGTVLILAAEFQLGSGEVVVISEPAIARNRDFARADNSVFLAHVLSKAGGKVVFDEFYHGLTIRGNPMWLVTQRPYGVLAATLLAAFGLWIWRRAVFLGPPLQDVVESRRSIAEYVEAMARFLRRGRGSRRFLLREVRDGVLRTLRRELGLPVGRERVDDICKALARRDPPRAERLKQATAEIDNLLSQSSICTEEETVRAQQRISACL